MHYELTYIKMILMLNYSSGLALPQFHQEKWKEGGGGGGGRTKVQLKLFSGGSLKFLC